MRYKNTYESIPFLGAGDFLGRFAEAIGVFGAIYI